MNYFLIICLLATHVLFVFATAGSAQEIPQEVASECQASSPANKLPDCLISGAIAKTMLAYAASRAVFGPEVDQIIRICDEQNDTLDSTWICLRVAAEKAVETKNLIGLDAIVDQCVALLANEDALQNLSEKEDEVRDLFAPNNAVWGGGTYFAFEGCPAQKSQETGDIQISATAGDTNTLFDAKTCDAFSEVDRFLGANSAPELKSIFSVLELLPEEKRLEKLSDFGISKDAIDTIMEAANNGEEQAGSGLILVGVGLLERHHPDLVGKATAEGSSRFSDAFASGLFRMLTEAALEGYEEACSAVR